MKKFFILIGVGFASSLGAISQVTINNATSQSIKAHVKLAGAKKYCRVAPQFFHPGATHAIGKAGCCPMRVILSKADGSAPFVEKLPGRSLFGLGACKNSTVRILENPDGSLKAEKK